MFDNSEMRLRIILAAGLLVLGLWIQQTRAMVQAGGQAKIGIQVPTMTGKNVYNGNQRLAATDPASINLASGQLQIIEFYLPSDPVSQSTAQVMQTYEEKYRGKVHFVYIDVTDARYKNIEEKLNYVFYPQFTLIDGQGRIKSQWTNPIPSEMDLAIANASINHPVW